MICLLAMTIDDRLLNGVNVWTKPFKFALSISVYFATIAAMAQLLDRKTSWAGNSFKAASCMPVYTEQAN